MSHDRRDCGNPRRGNTGVELDYSPIGEENAFDRLGAYMDLLYEEDEEAFAEKVDHPVRKTAHATEYAILGLLIAGAYIERGTSIRKGILIPWGAATLYAATDEFHQLFVPGRSGQVSDVMLDSAGVLAGVLVLAAIRAAWRKADAHGTAKNK